MADNTFIDSEHRSWNQELRDDSLLPYITRCYSQYHFFSILKSLELTSKLHTLPWQRQLPELAVDLYSNLSDFSVIAKAYFATYSRLFVTGFNFSFTLVFTTGNVAKWLSPWALTSKERGSKPRNCDSKFNGMIEYFRYYRQLAFYFNLTTFKHDYNHQVAKIIRSNCNAILMWTLY